MQSRLLLGSLLTFAVSALTSAVAFRAAAPVVPHAERHGAWSALAPRDRYALTQLLSDLERGGDAPAALASARRVLKMPQSERDRYVAVLDEAAALAAALPLNDRDTLAQLAPAARAVWLLRELETHNPAGLTDLRGRAAPDSPRATTP